MTKASVWAVVAGLLVVVVVTTLVDILLHVLGGAAWLTARLAPDRPLRHAMILGYLGTLLAVVGIVATWNRGLGPRWYPIALAVLAIPQCWAGGKLYQLRAAEHPAA